MPRGLSTSRLNVRLKGQEPYVVHVGSHLLAQSASLAASAGVSPLRVLLVVDSNVPTKIVRSVHRSWESLGVSVFSITLHALEQRKSVETLAAIWQACSDAKLDRDDAIVALGGGLVGDVAGFAAATYRRGIAWVQCPTTLLACVDASVGGKTAINVVASRAGNSVAKRGELLIKNLVGNFHQPRVVVSDVQVLASLSQELVSDGLAECIKHACLATHAIESAREGRGRGGSLPQLAHDELARTSKLLPAVLAGSLEARAKLIVSNVATKAAIAGPDPLEQASDVTGGRALLNFGHTFGHILEGLAAKKGTSPLSHGQGVALGMVAAAHAGLALKLCSAGVVEDVMDAIAAAELPTNVPKHIAMPRTSELVARMISTDKKVRAGVLRIIVPVGNAPGTCKVIAAPGEHVLMAAWESLRH